MLLLQQGQWEGSGQLAGEVLPAGMCKVTPKPSATHVRNQACQTVEPFLPCGSMAAHRRVPFSSRHAGDIHAADTIKHAAWQPHNMP